jgi:hypothetical protein
VLFYQEPFSVPLRTRYCFSTRRRKCSLIVAGSRVANYVANGDAALMASLVDAFVGQLVAALYATTQKNTSRAGHFGHSLGIVEWLIDNAEYRNMRFDWCREGESNPQGPKPGGF